MLTKNQKIFLSSIVLALGLLSAFGTNPFGLNAQIANLLIFLGLVGLAFFALGG